MRCSNLQLLPGVDVLVLAISRFKSPICQRAVQPSARICAYPSTLSEPHNRIPLLGGGARTYGYCVVTADKTFN